MTRTACTDFTSLRVQSLQRDDAEGEPAQLQGRGTGNVLVIASAPMMSDM